MDGQVIRVYAYSKGVQVMQRAGIPKKKIYSRWISPAEGYVKEALLGEYNDRGEVEAIVNALASRCVNARVVG